MVDAAARGDAEVAVAVDVAVDGECKEGTRFGTSNEIATGEELKGQRDAVRLDCKSTGYGKPNRFVFERLIPVRAAAVWEGANSESNYLVWRIWLAYR